MPGSRFRAQKMDRLRARATRQLTGAAMAPDTVANGAAALDILQGLASSPATASDAVVLLHELQMYQVELDLQAEELRTARLALEEALQRQIQLYDFAPVGFFTMDNKTRLAEVNLTGARLLAVERDVVLGRPLVDYLDAVSRRALYGMLAQLEGGRTQAAGPLVLVLADGSVRKVHACVGADPMGAHVLVALTPLNPLTS